MDGHFHVVPIAFDTQPILQISLSCHLICSMLIDAHKHVYIVSFVYEEAHEIRQEHPANTMFVVLRPSLVSFATCSVLALLIVVRDTISQDNLDMVPR